VVQILSRVFKGKEKWFVLLGIALSKMQNSAQKLAEYSSKFTSAGNPNSVFLEHILANTFMKKLIENFIF